MAFLRPNLDPVRLWQRRLAFRLRLSLRLGHRADPARNYFPKANCLFTGYWLESADMPQLVDS